MIHITEEIQKLIDAGALFVVNTSGGKDSQCMTIELEKIIPKKQMVLVHAHLPEVEWDGIKEHIEQNAMGIQVHYVQAVKTFFQMVEHRQMFPSIKNRQCTSDLKRGPIQKFINNYARENGFHLVVNCMGLRAEESPDRAKKEVFKLNTGKTCKHRTQYEWLPIHHVKKVEVFKSVKQAGQELHWAYGEGMTRLSCCFCIMSSKQDLETAKRLRPELHQRYIDTQNRIGHSLQMPKKGQQADLENLYQGK